MHEAWLGPRLINGGARGGEQTQDEDNEADQ
jgi:hypothetical protein